MDLFERAGIILKPGERIAKRGRCKGKILKGVGKSASTGEPRLEREEVDGEMVLTDRRLVFLGQKLDEIVHFPDLDLKYLFAVRTVKAYRTDVLGRFVPKEDDLLLLVSIGFGKPEEIRIEVDGASEWVEAIKNQAGSSK